MNVSCQFSIYPPGVARLSPHLEAALGALRRTGLEPEMGPMSSIVSGQLGQIMAGLGEAFAAAASNGCVMVLTLSNACPVAGPETTLNYHALVITAHPDDAETQMGGTLAKLADRGQRILLVDLTEGEPSDFAAPGERARQAAEAARTLGVERLTLEHQDRFLMDDLQLRLEVAALIREHQPRTVYAIGEACVHPDHVAAASSITRAAVFYARLGRWGQVPDGARLAVQASWAVDRLFFPHCKMEGPWSEFAFAVDVSDVYDRKRRALAAYTSIFEQRDDRLLALYEVEEPQS